MAEIENSRGTVVQEDVTEVGKNLCPITTLSPSRPISLLSASQSLASGLAHGSGLRYA